MSRRYDFKVDEDPVDMEENGSQTKNRNSIFSVPFYIGIIFVLFLFALFSLSYYLDNLLPTARNVEDEALYPDVFITERARQDLKNLTDLGPRIVGGYKNEDLAVKFIKTEIESIAQNAHPNQTLEMDIQEVTGSKYLTFGPLGRINAYSNLQNIVVKLHSSNSSSQNSLLVNSHFDSTPTSPGGSDDGINVAIMLEVLRKLTMQPNRLLHNVIFLFNGAEETGLQASHGFIMQHKWAKECKVVVNLEAAGAGGKIILFQSGPEIPWLMKYYARVPHPYGQAAGEEIFQSNIIPSDTDFRIFRDYGNLVGLDMAFYKDGYRYHTKYDGYLNIPLGSYQHAGDNTLSLVTNIANAPEMDEEETVKYKMVFFDIFGLFVISYTETMAILINVLTAVLSVGSLVWAFYTFNMGNEHQPPEHVPLIRRLISGGGGLKCIGLIWGAVLLGWVSAVLFVYLTATVLDSLSYSMSWYRNPWMIFGLYVVPVVAITCSVSPLIRRKNVSVGISSQLQAHAVRVLWTVVLLAGTAAQIRAMYFFMLPVLFSSVAFLIIQALCLQHSVRAWQIIYICIMIFPAMFLMYCAELTMSLFIPVTGRMGSGRNADAIIGLLSSFFTISITSPFAILAVLMRNFKYFLVFMTTLFVISLVIVFTPLGFPYSGNSLSPTPERYWITHSSRVLHAEDGSELKQDAGYFILNMDRNSPNKVKPYVKELSKAKPIDDDCDKFLFCGLPISHSRMTQIVRESTWIPAGPPIVPETVSLNWTKADVSPSVMRYSISIKGPDHTVVFLSAKKNYTIKGINLLDRMPPAESTMEWNGRPIYYIFHIYGKGYAPLNFTFDVEVPPRADRRVTTEITINGIYVHEDRNVHMPHYNDFLNKFPDWADVTPYLAHTESWWV